MHSRTCPRRLMVVLGAMLFVALGPALLSTVLDAGYFTARAQEESPPSTSVVKEVEKPETKASVPEPSGEDRADKETKDSTSADETETEDAAKDAKEPADAAKQAAPAKENKENVDEKTDLKPSEETAVDSEPKAEGRTASHGKPAPEESFLEWLYTSLGTRYVVIFLIITFNAVALIVMIVLGLRRNVICPEELAAEFEEKLNEKKYQEAYELCKQNRSFLGKVLAAGMARLPDGFDAAQQAMQDVGDEQTLRLEQRNGYIALIAQIGPMFGLLGTVDGMVMAFDVIANSNVTPKPSELAQGIGTALVTTVVGLWIAIPMLVFYNIIHNRLSRLLAEAGLISTNLMKRFATVKIPAAKKDKEKES